MLRLQIVLFFLLLFAKLVFKDKFMHSAVILCVFYRITSCRKAIFLAFVSCEIDTYGLLVFLFMMLEFIEDFAC